MHTRQGGAAHINIFYFLIILVMFFGVLGFGYLQLTRNAQLETDNADLDRTNRQLAVDITLLEHYAEDISAAIQISGDYVGRPRIVYDDPEDDTITAQPLQNVASIEQMQDQLRQFATGVGVPEAQGIPDFLNRVRAAFEARTQQIADAQSELQRRANEKSAADASFLQAAADAAQRESALNAQLTTTRDDLESQIAQKDNLMTQLTSQVQQRNSQLSSEREDRAAEVRELNDQRNRIQAQNDAMRQRTSLINPPDAPDGRVITASQELGVAIINLGRKDMLQSGTVFRISSPGGGALKATGTVTRVRDEQADLAISDLADRFNPVGPGDLISNELYSPNVRRNIYLLGRFGYPYSKADVKDLLERLGNTVVDQIQPGVDLVVVGNDLLDEETGTVILLSETPEYREVLDLSIEVAPLNRIRELLRFDAESR